MSWKKNFPALEGPVWSGLLTLEGSFAVSSAAIGVARPLRDSSEWSTEKGDRDHLM